MAIYVCDFEAVEIEGKNTCANAEDMNSNLVAYRNDIKENLSGWTGSARQAFDSSNESVILRAEKLSYVGDSLGEFILLAKDAIYELEQDLGSMNI